MASRSLSCSLSPTVPLRSPYPNMNALHDQKGDCHCRPRPHAHTQHSLHAMNATISWRMSAKTRQGQKKSPTCSIGYGGTRFSCEQSGTEERGDSRRCGQVWAALWQWWRRRRRGGRSLCFIIKAAKSLPLFAMRCAEPMDGCRRDAGFSLPSLLYPLVDVAAFLERIEKHCLNQDTDMFRCQLQRSA